MTKSRFSLQVYNGRYKVKVDGMVLCSFNQIDFKGYYAFKDDHSLFGIDFYLAGGVVIETAYKTRAVWEGILRLLDETI